MSIRTAFSYTRALIKTVRWTSRTPKTSYGKSIRTMMTAATFGATSYTGTINIHMGRSSKRTGPTLIRLRGTPVGLQSASLMTLGPVGRSKFSKSTASRLNYLADGPCRLLPQSGEPTKLSSRAALLGNFETRGRGHFRPNTRQQGTRGAIKAVLGFALIAASAKTAVSKH